MELRGVDVSASPRGSGFVRLRGEVTYDDAAHPAEEYWFDVASSRSDVLTTSGNPWLACLAPVAATLGEPLRIEPSVDEGLLENVRELLRIWTAWYPNLRPVSIEVNTGQTPTRQERRTASFFSGGVDSFFTVLRHANGEGTPRTEPIDDLIFIQGYDIPLENEAAFSATLTALERAAGELDRRLVVTATNLRETRFGGTDWCGLSHGAALAAVGLALEPAYKTLLISSSAGYRDLRFWGSHPLTDPLFSTSATRVVHDGPAFMRAEKTEYISTSDIALQTLRVCWRSASGLNCNGCNNCYRTMLTLEALGLLDRCSTFDSGALDLHRAERIYCPRSYDIRQYGYVRFLAERNGRTDIVRAIDRSLTGSARLKGRIDLLRRMRDRRILWRWAKPLEDRLLREWRI
jgi:hypothetical protein